MDALDTSVDIYQPIIKSAVKGALRWWPSLPSALDYEDLAQQCWCVLPQLITDYQVRPGVSYNQYLITSLRWYLRRYIRSFSTKRSQHAVVFSADHDKLIDWQDYHLAESPTWVGEIETSESLQTLEGLLLKVLGLHAIYGYSFTTISQRLGLPRATVYDLYRRALDGARQALTETTNPRNSQSLARRSG